jgi:hypothetical protein
MGFDSTLLLRNSLLLAMIVLVLAALGCAAP